MPDDYASCASYAAFRFLDNPANNLPVAGGFGNEAWLYDSTGMGT
jgi:hypothetical protein